MGPWTNFQYPLFGGLPYEQPYRKTPDISADASTSSPVWIFYNGQWLLVGGTSVATPVVAGIVNNSNNRLGVAPSPGGYYTSAENNLLYAELLSYKDYATNFYDVTTGSNGASARRRLGLLHRSWQPARQAG